MTHHFTFGEGPGSFTISLSSIDQRLIEVFFDSSTRIAPLMQQIFGYWGPGIPPTAPQAELLAGLDKLLGDIERDLDLLPYCYASRTQHANGMISSGTGGVHGIRLNGDPFFYGLDAGFGELTLTKRAADKDGRGYVVDTTDVRHLKEIATDNMGTIVISRRRLKTGLPESLRRLRAFLAEQAEGDIPIGYSASRP